MDEPAPGSEPEFLPPLQLPTLSSAAHLQGTVNLASIYEAARQMAVRDVEIDRLFNAEYYEEP